MFPEKIQDIQELMQEGKTHFEVVDILVEGRVSHILAELRDKAIDISISSPMLQMNRSCIWTSAQIFYKKAIEHGNLLNKNLTVSFSGEEGIDGGALRNEFFVSAIKTLDSKYFEGNQCRRLPLCHWGCEVEQKIGGALIAHSLLLGGPGLPCLHPAIYQVLCGVEIDEIISIEDIPLNLATAGTIDLITKVLWLFDVLINYRFDHKVLLQAIGRGLFDIL